MTCDQTKVAWAKWFGKFPRANTENGRDAQGGKTFRL